MSMSSSPTARSEFKTPDNSSTESKQECPFVLKRAHASDLQKFDASLGDEKNSGDPKHLTSVFDHAQLSKPFLESLQKFCTSHLGDEMNFLDPDSVAFNEKLLLGSNQSVFNDEGEFQFWVLPLMPGIADDTDGKERAKQLAIEIKNLIFTQINALLINIDDENSFQKWVITYFREESDKAQKKYRVSTAIDKFKWPVVRYSLTTALASVFCRHLEALIQPEKNKRFIRIAIALINHQLNTSSVFLDECQKVKKSLDFANNLLLDIHDDNEYEQFEEFVNNAIDHLPTSDCGKFIPLLSLYNQLATLSENSLMLSFGVHGLLCFSRKFNKAQKNASSSKNSDMHFNEINAEINETIKLLPKELLPDESNDSDNNREENFIEKAFYAEIIFKHLNKKIYGAIKEIKNEAFSRKCQALAETFCNQQLQTKLLDALREEKNGDISVSTENVKAHIKKLEEARFIFEFATDSTHTLCKEIFEYYLTSRETFPPAINQYFERAIKSLGSSQAEDNADWLIPILKYANTVAKKEFEDESIKEFYFEIIQNAADRFIEKLGSRTPTQKTRAEFKNYMAEDLAIFNKLHSADQGFGLGGLAGNESKEAVTATLSPQDAKNIFERYKKIKGKVLNQIRDNSDESEAKQYKCLLQYVTTNILNNPITKETLTQLQSIYNIIKFIQSIKDGGQWDQTHTDDLDKITGIYHPVKKILILECLRQKALHSVIIDEHLRENIKIFISLKQNRHTTFYIDLFDNLLLLEKLNDQISNLEDPNLKNEWKKPGRQAEKMLLEAGHIVYEEAYHEFENLLRGQKDPRLTPATLNRILMAVDQLITHISNNPEGRPFPFEALTKLQNLNIPGQTNWKRGLWSGLACFVGLATIVAGYYFSPMTAGISAAVATKISYAMMLIGTALAGAGVAGIISSQSSGLAKSLGGFLSEKAVKDAANAQNREPAGKSETLGVKK